MLGIKVILAIVVCLLGLGIKHEHNVMAQTLSFHTGHPKKYRALAAVRKKMSSQICLNCFIFRIKKFG